MSNLNGTVFQDYAAQQGDFGGAFTAPPAGIPQPNPSQGVPAPPLLGGISPPAPPQADTNPVAQNPFFQFYNMYKGSSKEKQKTAIARLSQDAHSPLDMGLPYDAGVLGKVKTEPKTGKTLPDPSAWKKFITFVDSNPQFLLDLGTQLLQPRQNGQSQFGAIAAGLQSATQRLGQRRAATAAGVVAAKKSASDIASVDANTGKVASEINLNNAKASKLRADMTVGAAVAKAPAVQKIDYIANALFTEFGRGPDAKYTTKSQAILAAQQILDHTADPATQAYYDQVKTNTFIAGAADAIIGAKQTLQNAPKSPLESLQAQAAAKKHSREQAAFKKMLLSDPKKLTSWLRTQPGNGALTTTQMQAKVDAIMGTGKPAAPAAPVKAVGKKVAASPLRVSKTVADTYLRNADKKSVTELRRWQVRYNASLSTRQRIRLSKIIQRKLRGN